MIYADNAATTKMDIEAFEAMKPFLLEEYGNPSQPYFFSKTARIALREARETIAKCINADPDEIYFTSGGTESDNWAIKEFGGAAKTKYIITSAIEHKAILNACTHMEKQGAIVEYVPVTPDGVILVDELEKKLRERSNSAKANEETIVSVMFVNNEIGTIEPITQIAEVVHRYGAIFHTDAVQAVGHVAIDVKKMGIDMLSASAHKFNGPKGIGFLYVKKGIDILSHNDGGVQENGKRAGTENVCAIVGMAKALENNIQNIEYNQKRILELERIIEDGLLKENIEYIRNGSREHVPGNMSLSFRGFEGEALLHRLDLMRICVSTGSACDSEKTSVSHVLKAINLKEDLAIGTIRISLGKYNTADEAMQIVDALHKILK